MLSQGNHAMLLLISNMGYYLKHVAGHANFWHRPQPVKMTMFPWSRYMTLCQGLAKLLNCHMPLFISGPLDSMQLLSAFTNNISWAGPIERVRIRRGHSNIWYCSLISSGRRGAWLDAYSINSLQFLLLFLRLQQVPTVGIFLFLTHRLECSVSRLSRF